MLPSDAPAALARLAKVDQWKADLEACLAPSLAAASSSPATADGLLLPLPSSAALDSLETRYKELECVVPDHRRMEPLLRDYKRWRERHKPWSEFFLWCKAARAGCFLSGDGYDPSSALLAVPTAAASLLVKRVKTDTPAAISSAVTGTSAVTDRRRRASIEVQALSSPVAGKKSGREGSGKRGAEEDSDLTLYGRRISLVAVFVLLC